MFPCTNTEKSEKFDLIHKKIICFSFYRVRFIEFEIHSQMKFRSILVYLQRTSSLYVNFYRIFSLQTLYYLDLLSWYNQFIFRHPFVKRQISFQKPFSACIKLLNNFICQMLYQCVCCPVLSLTAHWRQMLCDGCTFLVEWKAIPKTVINLHKSLLEVKSLLVAVIQKWQKQENSKKEEMKMVEKKTTTISVDETFKCKYANKEPLILYDHRVYFMAKE